MTRIINGNQVTDREMTDEETALHKLRQKGTAAYETAQAAQAAAKKSAYTKLAALGLTADEIAAL